jgi:hypothetical protein
MIKNVGQIVWHQNRDVTPTYDTNGKIVEMKTSKIKQLSVSFCIYYDDDHAGLIDDLLKSVREITAVCNPTNKEHVESKGI